MPLIEVNISHQVSASIRLDEATVRMVDQYAAMLHAPADDVVNATLVQTLTKCKDFQAFLKTTQAEQARSSLRVRKPMPTEAEVATKKPGSPASLPTQTAASATGSRA